MSRDEIRMGMLLQMFDYWMDQDSDRVAELYKQNMGDIDWYERYQEMLETEKCALVSSSPSMPEAAVS